MIRFRVRRLDGTESDQAGNLIVTVSTDDAREGRLPVTVRQQ
jgi:hypothetical protein